MPTDPHAPASGPALYRWLRQPLAQSGTQDGAKRFPRRPRGRTIVRALGGVGRTHRRHSRGDVRGFAASGRSAPVVPPGQWRLPEYTGVHAWAPHFLTIPPLLNKSRFDATVISAEPNLRGTSVADIDTRFYQNYGRRTSRPG